MMEDALLLVKTHWVSFASLNRAAILSKSSNLIDMEFVGDNEWRPPSWKLTVLFVVISADMWSICVLKPHFIYLTL